MPWIPAIRFALRSPQKVDDSGRCPARTPARGLLIGECVLLREEVRSVRRNVFNVGSCVVILMGFSACVAIVDGPSGHVDPTGSETGGSGSGGATSSTSMTGTGGASTTHSTTTTTTTGGAGGGTGSGTGTGTGGGTNSDAGPDARDASRPDTGIDSSTPGACVLDRVLGQSVFSGW